MRRHFQRTLALVLLLLLAAGPCTTALAADGWQRVDLPGIGVNLSIPNGYDIFTRNMPEDSPVLARYGMTAEAITELLVSGNLFLDACSFDGTKEILVTMVGGTISDLSILEENTLRLLASMWIDEFENTGIKVAKYDIYHNGPITFVRIWEQAPDDPAHYCLQYYTTFNYQAINITMHSYAGSLSSADEAMILNVVNSAVFQKASDAPAQAAVQTDPAELQYTVLDDQTVQVTGYTGESPDLSIPETLDGRPVTRIGEMGTDYPVTSIAIPASVTAIEGNPFMTMYELETISVAEGSESFIAVDGVLFSADQTRLICHPPRHANQTYSIPKQTRIVGRNAFHDCTRLLSVEVPNGVETIEREAFEGVSHLTEIHLPRSIQRIDGNPFEYNFALTSISVDPQNPDFYAQDDVLYSRTDKKLQAFPYNKAIDGFSIPDGIVAIGEHAFSNHTGNAAIVFPQMLQRIEAWAFNRCEGFVFPELLGDLTFVGAYAFCGCETITEVTIPPTAEVEARAFFGCSRLQRVSVQNGVTSIGDEIFAGCTALRDVSLPSTLVAIGERAFKGCEALTELAIPASVTSIGEKAFEDCPNLTLYVAQGSYVEGYCQANGLRYAYASAWRP